MVKNGKKILFLAMTVFLAAAKTVSVRSNIYAQTKTAVNEKGIWENKEGVWKYFDKEHKLVKGWMFEDPDWYYLDALNGTMMIEWSDINGVRYYFDKKSEGIEGRMHTGWYRTLHGDWYFFDTRQGHGIGAMLTGWQWIDGYCYYFETMKGNDYGKLYISRKTPDGYDTNHDGRWIDYNDNSYKSLSYSIHYIEGKGILTKQTSDKSSNLDKSGLSKTLQSKGTGSSGSGSTGGSGKGGGSGSNGGSGNGGGSGNDRNNSIPGNSQNPQTQTNPESKPQQEQKPQSQPQPEQKPNPKPQPKPESQPKPEPQPQPQPKPDKIEKFEINSSNIKKVYKTGEKLDLGGIKIKLIMSGSGDTVIEGWENCIHKGFISEPENGYIFKEGDIGQFRVVISITEDGVKHSGEFNLEVSKSEDENTNMEKIDIEVDGVSHTYYYRKYTSGSPDESFIVKGRDIAGKVKAIKNYKNPNEISAYYYVEDSQEIKGNIYGTADIGYADFYYSEIIKNKLPHGVNLDNDPYIYWHNIFVWDLEHNQGYDAVTSPTKNNYGAFKNASYVKNGSGYIIRGVITNVEVDGLLYAKGRILSAAGVYDKSNFLEIINSMSAYDKKTGVKRAVTSVKPYVYKTLYWDSSLSELKFSESAPDIDASKNKIKVSINDRSKYGQYEINIENLPEGIDTTENVLGIILKTGEGDYKSSGLEFIDNIWTENGRLAFSTEKRDGTNDRTFRRYTNLKGKKITSITYLLSDHKKFIINNPDIYVLKPLSSKHKAVITEKSSFIKTKGAKARFDTSQLPYTGVSLKALYLLDKDDEKQLIEGNDYTYSDNVLTVNDTENTMPGKYRIVFSDVNSTSGYTSYSLDFDFIEGNEELPEQSVKIIESEAAVEGFGYNVRLKVTYNQKEDVILKVEDNNTNSGSNSMYWVRASIGMLSKYKGKGKNDIYKVDVVSGATLTSKAIREAVRIAVGGEKGEEDDNDHGKNPGEEEDPSKHRIIEGESVVNQWAYTVKIKITYNVDTGKIIKIEDNGTDTGLPANAQFYNQSKAMFKRLAGKKRSELFSVDSVSGATLSSDAIRIAAYDALRDAGFN